MASGEGRRLELSGRRRGRFVVEQLGDAKTDQYQNRKDQPAEVTPVHRREMVADHRENQGNGHVRVVLGTEARNRYDRGVRSGTPLDCGNDFSLAGPDPHPDISRQRLHHSYQQPELDSRRCRCDK